MLQFSFFSLGNKTGNLGDGAHRKIAPVRVCEFDGKLFFDEAGQFNRAEGINVSVVEQIHFVVEVGIVFGNSPSLPNESTQHVRNFMNLHKVVDNFLSFGFYYLLSRLFNCRTNSARDVCNPSGTPHRATRLAGLPCTTVIGGTDAVTTLPALMTAPSPMMTPGKINAHAPM